MSRYFLLVVQSSIGTVILLAMLLALLSSPALKGSGKGRGLPFLCLAGTLAALVLAFLRRTTAVNIGKISTFTAALAIIAGIVFLFRELRQKARISLSGVSFFADTALVFLLPFYALPAVFLYPSEFLLAGESAFSTDFLFKCIGYLAGIGLSLLTGLCLYKIGRGMGKGLSLILCGALIINMANQVCTVLQFLFARRMIPMNRTIFRLITPALNNSIVFLFGILAITSVLPVLAFIQSCTFGSGSHRQKTYSNPAERRKVHAVSRHRKQLCITLAASYAVTLLSLTVLKAWNEKGVELSPAESYNLSGNEIVIPLELIEDGHLHRYNYRASENIEMRFIIIKKNESAYGVGLDACDICGPTGYYERKDEVICRLCDVVMNKATIGFRGGCNPVPLAYTLRSGNMIIQTESLEIERARFK
ncbi:DUF2318 domain-containing protein [Leadbettera azotonutricia]|uniref:Putative membrane protein n=1 Tax=Leadbettera azotonutricia (strain ATCC BAA-888 / DSM 13862 / ZAS-9) TaxID=545695 RepID=F5YCI1_LEAAZ|nr:DUF2318 domain-containing protein [Leadbettera azotonutricia]AEF80794.1 putative membrane protein [Leadbettera azotonutricia ZAS-9]